MDGDGIGAPSSHHDAKERHSVTKQDRNVLNSAIWRKRRALKREKKNLTKIAKRVEAGKAPKPIAAKHFNWTPMAKDQEPKKVLTDFFQELYSIPDDQAVFAQKEKDALDGVMEELEGGLRSGFVDFDEKAAWGAGQAEEREGLPRWHHCRCTERDARGQCGKTGMSTVEDVLGHEVPAKVDVLVNGHGPEGRGCIEPCEVQPECGVVCDATDTGLCLAQVIAPSTMRDNPASVCADDTCRRWPVPVGESSGTFTRVATRNGDGTAGREEGVRPVDHRAAFKATRLQSLSPFSMALIATIWDGSCMKPRLGSISSGHWSRPLSSRS